MIAVGQGAVDAADALGLDELSFAEHLFGHGPHLGGGGQQVHHPLLAARLAEVPAKASAVVGTVGVFFVFAERANPSGGVVAAAVWRCAVPQPGASALHKRRIEHAALDEVAVALEEAHFVGRQHVFTC